MVKFARCAGPDATGVNSTAASDRRITFAGRLLRAFKLDEIPSLERPNRHMSLVGPGRRSRRSPVFTRGEKRMLTSGPASRPRLDCLLR